MIHVSQSLYVINLAYQYDNIISTNSYIHRDVCRFLYPEQEETAREEIVYGLLVLHWVRRICSLLGSFG